jgi:hypothetical protein
MRRRSTHKTHKGLKRRSRKAALIRRRSQKGGAEPVVGVKTRNWVSAFKEHLEAINNVVPTFSVLTSATLTLNTFAEEPIPTNAAVEGAYNLTLNIINGTTLEVNDLRNMAAATFQLLRLLDPSITKENIGNLTPVEFRELMEKAASVPTNDYADSLEFLLKGENSIREIGGEGRLSDLYSDATVVLYIWGILVNTPVEDLEPIAPALNMEESAPMLKGVPSE